MTQTPEEVDEAALETAITLVVTTLEARLTAVDHELSILNERADRLRNLRRQYVEKLKALRGKEAIEPPGPQVQCPICQRGFDSDQGLIVHTNRMHKKVEMAPIPAPSPLEQRRTKLMGEKDPVLLHCQECEFACSPTDMSMMISHTVMQHKRQPTRGERIPA